MSVSPRLKIATVALALVAAVVPTPASWIERVYSERSYLSVQRLITSASNLVPIALLDVGCLVLLISFLLHSLRILRRPAASRWPLRRLVLVDAITLLAAVYLLFLAVWGLNYRREPLRARLQFDRGRASQSALLETTREVVRRLNDLDGSRSRDDGPALDAVPQLLVRPFVRTQELLGQPRIALGGVPKASLLREYFRRTAISGMTNPFFLEVIINDELVPSERPFVVAHEWAHLAGYADEAEASFVAWLTCVRGDAIAQYSG
ncbi:MAG: DUF3810 family protein, partial [Acidobacteria bacterium]|nr:DUF3810 family protein [Acidobacteriota bacterium]